MKKITISTSKRFELVDITDKIKSNLDASNGLITIFTPHSTASILITENEPNLKKDWINFFKSRFDGKKFNHDKLDGNGDSHLLAGIIGPEETIILEDGLFLGAWQRVFLAEFDGPRSRKVLIKTIKND